MNDPEIVCYPDLLVVGDPFEQLIAERDLYEAGLRAEIERLRLVKDRLLAACRMMSVFVDLAGEATADDFANVMILMRSAIAEAEKEATL